MCNIADVVAPPLPPEGATVTVEEQIRFERLSLHPAAAHCSCALQLPPPPLTLVPSEQLSSISTLLQQQQLNDGSDQATHAKLAIQYRHTPNIKTAFRLQMHDAAATGTS